MKELGSEEAFLKEEKLWNLHSIPGFMYGLMISFPIAHFAHCEMQIMKFVYIWGCPEIKCWSAAKHTWA